jgi:hypothetical protein
MSSEPQVMTREPSSQLMSGALVISAGLVVARFIFELAGMPQDFARYISSTVRLPLVAIYVAAVGPLRGGLRKFSQLLLPALILTAWTQGWIILATIVAAVLHLSRTHFAENEDFGNWGHLGRHVLGHVVEIGVFFCDYSFDDDDSSRPVALAGHGGPRRLTGSFRDHAILDGSHGA